VWSTQGVLIAMALMPPPGKTPYQPPLHPL